MYAVKLFLGAGKVETVSETKSFVQAQNDARFYGARNQKDSCVTLNGSIVHLCSNGVDLS